MLYTNWVFWVWIIVAILIGAIIGFFVAQKQLKIFTKKPTY